MGWFSRFRYRYVGTVEGKTDFIDRDGNPIPGGYARGYWLLTENGFGRRKAARSGEPGNSPHAKTAGAAVRAWLAGGSVPELWDSPQPERKAELISFPGGKGDAA